MQQLPFKFKLKRQWYAVQQYPLQHVRCQGRFYPTRRAIEIFAGRKRAPRKPAEIRQTFWHEVTHAILHQMKHPLWNDEAFVEGFSQLLSQAIDTSEFVDDPVLVAAPVKGEQKYVFFDKKELRWRK